MSSLLTLNYFTTFPSFPIVDFEQVNICWENYLTFYMCLMEEGRTLEEAMQGIPLFLLFHKPSEMCNLSKPSITQIIRSFGDTK